MAFVYEKIDETRKQELLNLAKPPTVLGFSYVQIIDYENDIIFLILGGQGERPKEDAMPPNFYSLLWHGVPIHFSAYETGKKINDVYTYFYEIPLLFYPKTVEVDMEVIKKTIRAAMECFMQGCRTFTKPIVAPILINNIQFI